SVSTNFTTSASSEVRSQKSEDRSQKGGVEATAVFCPLTSDSCHFGTSDGTEPVELAAPELVAGAGAVAGAPGTSDGLAGSTRSMTPFSMTPCGTPRCEPR